MYQLTGVQRNIPKKKSDGTLTSGSFVLYLSSPVHDGIGNKTLSYTVYDNPRNSELISIINSLSIGDFLGIMCDSSGFVIDIVTFPGRSSGSK